LLVNVGISQEIQARLAEHSMSAEESLALLSDQARNLGTRYIKPDGSVDLAGLIRDGYSHLIKSVKDSKYGGVQVEFVDCQQALLHIGKHHKLFTEQTAFSGTVTFEGLEQILDKVYGRPSTIELSEK
jgi:hypothetical protein